MRKVDVSPGDRYGSLVVLSEEQTEYPYRTVRVECVCGEIRTVRLNSLRTGNTSSCGCRSGRLPIQWGPHLWSVDVPTGCWIWLGARDLNGYALLGSRRVARRVLSDKVGRPLAQGEVTRHTCDNPPCVNPNSGNPAREPHGCSRQGAEVRPQAGGPLRPGTSAGGKQHPDSERQRPR